MPLDLAPLKTKFWLGGQNRIFKRYSVAVQRSWMFKGAGSVFKMPWCKTVTLASLYRALTPSTVHWHHCNARMSIRMPQRDCCCQAAVAVSLLLPVRCCQSVAPRRLLLPGCCYQSVAPRRLLLSVCCCQSVAPRRLLLPVCCCQSVAARRAVAAILGSAAAAGVWWPWMHGRWWCVEWGVGVRLGGVGGVGGGWSGWSGGQTARSVAYRAAPALACQ